MKKDSNFFIKIFCGLICYCFSATFCFAQINASAKLDTTTIKLGDQQTITLSFKYSEAKGKVNVTWPTFKDAINEHIEIVSKSRIDTTKDSLSNAIIQRQKLTITSFDSGYYTIPGFVFYYQVANDTAHYKAETEPLFLTVKTIPVDTTKEIKQIKPPVEVPFNFEDALPYILGALAVIVVAIIIYLLIKKYRKPKNKEVIPAKPTRPPHEIALEALETLEKEKLWQEGNYKLYHSTLADIIRTYIEYRYEINAMELPTDDTLSLLKTRIGNPIVKEKLRQALELADLVKFAKNQPLGVENEASIKNAYDFINSTKLVLDKNEGKEEILG